MDNFSIPCIFDIIALVATFLDPHTSLPCQKAYFEEYVNLHNEYEKNLQNYRRILSVCELYESTDDEITLMNFGTIYATSGKYFEALILLNEVIELNPLLDKAYNNLALIAYVAENSERELYFLEKAIEVNPQNTQALQSLSQYYFERNDMDKCLSYARKAALFGNIACKNWLSDNGY